MEAVKLHFRVRNALIPTFTFQFNKSTHCAGALMFNKNYIFYSKYWQAYAHFITVFFSASLLSLFYKYDGIVISCPRECVPSDGPK